MIRTLNRSTFIFTVLTLIAGSLLPVQGQIASPQNAAQGSGNNGAVSSTTSIGSPNFSQPQTILLVRGIKVKEDGSLEGEPVLELRLKQVYQLEIIRNNLQSLAPLGYESVLFASTAFPQPILSSAHSTLPSTQDYSFQIAIDGEATDLPGASQDNEAMRLFIRQANNLRLDAFGLKLGLKLVGKGVPIEPAIQLATSVQALNVNPSVDSLARSITAFNTVVNSASPELRSRLNSDPSFIGVSNTLRAMRNSLSPQP